MLWYDSNGQIVASAASIDPASGLTALEAASPGTDLTAYRVTGDPPAAVAKTATTLTASATTVAHGSPVSLNVPAGETVTFAVTGPGAPTVQSVAAAGATCTLSFTPPAAGTYTARAVGFTTYSNAVTITAT